MSLVDELNLEIKKNKALQSKLEKLGVPEQNLETLTQKLEKINSKVNHDFEYKVECEYSLFCAWCNAYKNFEYSEQNFKEYTHSKKDKVNFWIRKRIAEKYFNYKFNYNHDTNKWESMKEE